jgi:hypothetical protein
MDAAQIEKTAADFSLEKVMAARARAFAAMAAIAEKIRPGMLEEEAYELAKEILAACGAEKNWHRPYVRFGRNTLKKYGEPSEPGVRLAPEDVYYLDFGPVFDGYEGDVGDTYVVGTDADMLRCARDARTIFTIVREEWRKSKLSGADLYKFAEAQAARLGWVLHLGVDGHRLSEFPHALYFKGSMIDLDFVPQAHVWVLEIQIRHPGREFGAFYEDLLF